MAQPLVRATAQISMSETETARPLLRHWLLARAAASVVDGIQRLVREGAEDFLELFKLRLKFYAREQFLSDDSDDSRTTLFDKFSQLRGDGGFLTIEVARRAA